MIYFSTFETLSLHKTLIFAKNHVNKKNFTKLEKQSLMS